MSADNGIYILPVMKKDGSREFRVAYGGAIENVYYNADREDGYNGSMLELYFSKAHGDDARICETMSEAYEIAESMDEDWNGTEYGICILKKTDYEFGSVAPYNRYQ